MLFRYWKLEQKKTFLYLGRSIRYFAAAILIIAALVCLCKMVFRDANILPQITVAVAIPEEKEEELHFLTQIASAMRSVKSVCKFQYMDEEEALRQMKQEKVQAVMVFPQHLYQDLDEGNNTSVKLYFPKETSVSMRMFQEVLENGISMLCSAEAGVSAIVEQVPQGFHGESSSDIGFYVAACYMQTIFARGELFDAVVYSPYGLYGQKEYYFSAAVLLLFLTLGIVFSHLYRRSDRALQEKLRLYGISPGKIAITKIVAMANVLFVVVGSVYVIGCLVCSILASGFLIWRPEILVGWYLLCLVFAGWYHVLYHLVGESQMGILVLIAVEAWLALGSGLLIPLDYLPKFMYHISRLLPLYQWQQYNMDLLFGEVSLARVLQLCGWGAVGILIGMVTACKRE